MSEERCQHGIRAPWACDDCDRAAYEALTRAAPDLYAALEHILRNELMLGGSRDMAEAALTKARSLTTQGEAK